MKSTPELWAELEGDRLGAAVGAKNVRATEPERELAWEADGATGLARLEPSSWGTKVTLTAWVQEAEAEVARNGRWSRFFKRPVEAPPRVEPANDLEAKLNGLLDDLGSAHKKPFTTE